MNHPEFIFSAPVTEFPAERAERIPFVEYRKTFTLDKVKSTRFQWMAEFHQEHDPSKLAMILANKNRDQLSSLAELHRWRYGGSTDELRTRLIGNRLTMSWIEGLGMDGLNALQNRELSDVIKKLGKYTGKNKYAKVRILLGFVQESQMSFKTELADIMQIQSVNVAFPERSPIHESLASKLGIRVPLENNGYKLDRKKNEYVFDKIAFTEFEGEKISIPTLYRMFWEIDAKCNSKKKAVQFWMERVELYQRGRDEDYGVSKDVQENWERWLPLSQKRMVELGCDLLDLEARREKIKSAYESIL